MRILFMAGDFVMRQALNRVRRQREVSVPAFNSRERYAVAGSEPEGGGAAFRSGWIDTLVNYFSEENYEF
jgi:hypothetical protein